MKDYFRQLQLGFSRTNFINQAGLYIFHAKKIDTIVSTESPPWLRYLPTVCSKSFPFVQSQKSTNHSYTMADLVGAHMELYAKRALHNSKFLTHRQFVSFFGVAPAVVASVWRKLCREGLVPDGGTPVHLLWAFSFLKTYGIEPQMAMLFHTTRKTFREWVWRFVDAIYYLDVVSLLFGLVIETAS